MGDEWGDGGDAWGAGAADADAGAGGGWGGGSGDAGGDDKKKKGCFKVRYHLEIPSTQFIIEFKIQDI